MPVSGSDEEDYYSIDSQEMQPDPNPNDQNLPVTLMVNHSSDVNVLANEVNGWERLPVDTRPSLGSFLSLYLFLFILYLMNHKYFSTVAQRDHYNMHLILLLNHSQIWEIINCNKKIGDIIMSVNYVYKLCLYKFG